MRFCPKCDNMYYISIIHDDDDDTSDDKLHYYCRNCNNKEDISSIQDQDACVYTTQIKSTKQQFHHIINQYTKFDPTLPRVNTIPCPNDECKNSQNPEVIYIRYDDEMQSYIYICTHCDTVWRTDRFGEANEI